MYIFDIIKQINKELELPINSNQFTYKRGVRSMAAFNLPKKAGIYLIYCIKNQKKYIGSSVNISQRIRKHLSFLNRNQHPNQKIQNAYNKYGINSFQISVVEIVKDFDLLLEREQFWIDLYKSASRKTGFNLNPIADNNLQNKKQCKICKCFAKPLRKKRCHNCYEYLRRRNTERPYKSDGRIEKAVSKKDVICKRCNKSAEKNKTKPIKGFCASCYTWQWRQKKFGKTYQLISKKCLHCKQTFTTKYKYQKFCCRNHQAYFNRKKVI